MSELSSGVLGRVANCTNRSWTKRATTVKITLGQNYVRMASFGNCRIKLGKYTDKKSDKTIYRTISLKMTVSHCQLVPPVKGAITKLK